MALDSREWTTECVLHIPLPRRCCYIPMTFAVWRLRLLLVLVLVLLAHTDCVSHCPLPFSSIPFFLFLFLFFLLHTQSGNRFWSVDAVSTAAAIAGAALHPPDCFTQFLFFCSSGLGRGPDSAGRHCRRQSTTTPLSFFASSSSSATLSLSFLQSVHTHCYCCSFSPPCYFWFPG